MAYKLWLYLCVWLSKGLALAPSCPSHSLRRFRVCPSFCEMSRACLSPISLRTMRRSSQNNRNVSDVLPRLPCTTWMAHFLTASVTCRAQSRHARHVRRTCASSHDRAVRLTHQRQTLRFRIWTRVLQSGHSDVCIVDTVHVFLSFFNMQASFLV